MSIAYAIEGFVVWLESQIHKQIVLGSMWEGEGQICAWEFEEQYGGKVERK